MTAPIDDVSSLPGKKVSDQDEVPIGKVKDIYAIGGDGHPMWVSVEASFGLLNKRCVLVPLARLKDESGNLRVPYSKAHLEQGPQVDDEEEISPELDRRLRDHFGIDRADQELRSDNDSYATLVADDEEEGNATRVEDPSSLETPSADKIDDETRKRVADPGSAETRDVDAGAIADQNAAKGGSSDADSDTKPREGNESKSSQEDSRSRESEHGDDTQQSDTES